MAIGFGVGRLRPAPGTWGTLATVPLAVLVAWLGPFVHMGVCILLIPLSILAAEAYEQECGAHDSSEVVIDEVVGYLITVTWLPLTWQSFFIGFVLFRILDIWKPLFIGALDRKVPGGAGTILDDVAAGIVGNIVLQTLYYRTDILGVQWLGGLS